MTGLRRAHLKTGLALVLGATRTDRLIQLMSGTRRLPLVVGYHRVVDDFAAAAKTDMPSMLVSRAMFERHIDCIGRHFTFVGLDEIGEHRGGEVVLRSDRARERVARRAADTALTTVARGVVDREG